ncbi:MAG: hypothetical protein WAN35_16375 [Terracidiphilus sp.]
MYGNTSSVYNKIWALRRILRLSPMQRLMSKLKKRGVTLSQMDALELFGADGLRHTLDYWHLVRSLDIWEMDEKYLPKLRKNFPGAQIIISDTFKELQSASKTYDLLISDEPGQVFGQRNEHCEHFDLLNENLFRIARRSVVIVLNAVPNPLKQCPKSDQYSTYPGYMSMRAQFYDTDHPERISIEEMIPAYRRVLRTNGFNLDWHIKVLRTLRGGVYYLALKASRY